MNMYALLYIGLLLEPYLGKSEVFVSIPFHRFFSQPGQFNLHQYTISAGASGAIFGMYGFFLAMLTTDLIEKSCAPRALNSIGVFVAFNMINGLKGGDDNAAHIGGLLSGIVLGYVFIGGIKRSETKKSTITTILVVAFFVYDNIISRIY
jgi:rhomboid protease GluP